MVNPLIHVNGNAVRVESHVVMYRETEGGPKVAFGGRYIDPVVGQDGRSLFRRRKIITFLIGGSSIPGASPVLFRKLPYDAEKDLEEVGIC
jgi:hypothetical protein